MSDIINIGNGENGFGGVFAKTEQTIRAIGKDSVIVPITLLEPKKGLVKSPSVKAFSQIPKVAKKGLDIYLPLCISENVDVKTVYERKARKISIELATNGKKLLTVSGSIDQDSIDNRGDFNYIGYQTDFNEIVVNVASNDKMFNESFTVVTSFKKGELFQNIGSEINDKQLSKLVNKYAYKTEYLACDFPTKNTKEVLSSLAVKNNIVAIMTVNKITTPLPNCIYIYSPKEETYSVDYARKSISRNKTRTSDMLDNRATIITGEKYPIMGSDDDIDTDTIDLIRENGLVYTSISEGVKTYRGFAYDEDFVTVDAKANFMREAYRIVKNIDTDIKIIKMSVATNRLNRLVEKAYSAQYIKESSTIKATVEDNGTFGIKIKVKSKDKVIKEFDYES